MNGEANILNKQKQSVKGIPIPYLTSIFSLFFRDMNGERTENIVMKGIPIQKN